MAEKLDLPYQQASQVRQLLQELDNAEAYGQETRAAAVRKQLAELGYESVRKAEQAADAAQERAAAAEGEQARAEPPKGRTSRQQATTADEKAAAKK